MQELQISMTKIVKQLYIKHATTEKLNGLISKSKTLIIKNPATIATPTFFLLIFLSLSL